MRIFLAIFLAIPLAAQTEWLTGSLDAGYRRRTGIGGSANTYRSVVDLGTGLRLLGADFTLSDPKKRSFDRLDLQAAGWGGDPWRTLHVNARKSRLYDFTGDYRNIAYFNNLPSFADPLLSRGIVLDEQAFNVHRRLGSFELALLPGHWIVPYLAFDSDADSGAGSTTFAGEGNEFPLPVTIRDSTRNYRGGTRIELRHFHATLEQGGTTYKDDQSIYSNSGIPNYGNNSKPLPGRTLYLDSLLAGWGIRGSSIYSRGLFTASAASWLDLYGQFLYSIPENMVSHQQAATGSLANPTRLIFFTGQQYLLSAESKLPHSSGSIGAEVRPFRRLRILESWLTDRLYSGALSFAQQRLTPASLPQPGSTSTSSLLVTNRNQEETLVFLELTSKLTLHGGYRYVWGDASNSVLPASGLMPTDTGKLRRNGGLGGISFRPTHKLTIGGDAEGASSGSAYFRTSLYDYQRVRGRARYQISGSLNLSANFSLLNNANPSAGSNFEYLAHQESISLAWIPAHRFWNVEGTYTRSTLRSDISYLQPQDLQPAISSYRDNAHTASALIDLRLPSYSGLIPKFSFGGSLFVSSGSRPTTYYQPLAKLFVPLGKNLAWISDWSYYGFGESLYLYEGFHASLVTTGLRFVR